MRPPSRKPVLLCQYESLLCSHHLLNGVPCLHAKFKISWSHPLNSPSTHDQFSLLSERRFWPFFSAQFLGAFNDNLFKFAVTLLITYQWRVSWLPPALAGLIIGAVFISPFVLLSALSGQLADYFDKARILQCVKALEVCIMGLASLGFYLHSPLLLLLCIFFMGVHSTLFGPAKYAYLPERFNALELLGANALVEAGTFLAILLGNLLGGILITTDSAEQSVHTQVSWVCIGLALTGLAFSWFIPKLDAQDLSVQPLSSGSALQTLKTLIQNWNPLAQTLQSLRVANELPGMRAALFGISWMWFYGAVFLSIFPSFSKDLLNGSPGVASLLLFVFSLGIGAGSLLCTSLKHPDYELGLVFLGLLGMSLFTLDLAYSVNVQAYGGSLLELRDPSLFIRPPNSAILSIDGFLTKKGSFHILIDLALLSAFTGIFSVPLYTFIQSYSPSESCAKNIAANNILNALFMVSSAVIVGFLLFIGLTITQVFLALSISNLLALLYLAVQLPELQTHFVCSVREWIRDFKNPF